MDNTIYESVKCIVVEGLYEQIWFVLANHPQVVGMVLGIVVRTIPTYLRGRT
jgi:hypothetical protein